MGIPQITIARLQNLVKALIDFILFTMNLTELAILGWAVK
jgi:hypothetical protein